MLQELYCITFEPLINYNNMKKTIFYLGFVLSISRLVAQSNYVILNKIHLDGDGGYDYLTADKTNNRLYISHGNIVQVLDVESKKVLANIPAKRVHGITIADDLNKGYISNGQDSSVTVFDLTTLKTIKNVKVTGANPDAILYDKFSKKVFAFNGRSNNATVIDAKTDLVAATIALSGKPEFSASDENGKVYVNIEDKNEITVINTTTLKAERTWSIAPGEEPTGLALDNKTHRLFSVCGNKLMMIVNAETGKVSTSLPIGDGCDGVAFDTELKRAYSSNGEGTVTVVQEENENTYKVIETIKTEKGARTITVNSKTHHVFLPVAEREEAPKATPENPRPRAAFKPNSFTIIELGETAK